MHVQFPMSLVLFGVLLSGCHALDKKKDRRNDDRVGPAISLTKIGKPETTPLSKEAECETFAAALPDDYVHGNVTVPANWSKPEGPTIEVFYYGKSYENDKTPIVFFNGGPAGSSHSSYEVLSELATTSEVTMIYIDQRGTGCSSRFEGPTGDALEDYVANMQSLSAWGSRAIVQDAEAVRKHLFGDKKWSVFGQSYGALIVQRYLEIAPDSIVTASAHGYAALHDDTEWMSFRHLNQKIVGEAFLAAYPDIAPIMTDVRARLTPTTCYTDDESSTCGLQSIDMLYQYLGFTTQWESLHELLGQLRRSDGSLDEELLKGIIDLNFSGSDGDYDSMGGTAISAVEMLSEPVLADDVTRCKAAVARGEEKGFGLDHWLFSECRGQVPNALDLEKPKTDDQAYAAAFFEGVNASIKKDPLDMQLIRKNLEKHPDIKFYLYSGVLDAFVPPGVYSEALTAYGTHVRYTEFGTSGHDGFYSEEKVWNELTGAE